MSERFLTSLRLSASVAALALTLGVTPTLAQQQPTAPEAGTTATESQKTTPKSGMTGTDGQAAQATTPGSEQQATAEQAAPPENVKMVRARTFLGRQFNDQAGEQFGDIEYLLIEPVTGKIVFALVGSGGWLNVDQQLLAVPYDQIELSQMGEGEEMQLTLASDRQTIESAPRLDAAALNEMTRPVVQTRVVEYWDRVAPEGQQQGGQQTGATGQQGAQPSSGATGEQAGQQQGQQQDQQQAGATAGQAGQPQQGQQAQADGQTYTVVGKSYITTLDPPLVQTQQQLAGASVIDNQGNDVGEIEDLVMDAERGIVALALVEHGGFLGIGGEYTALPYQAMTWVDRAQFRIDQSQEQLTQAGEKVSFENVEQLDVQKVKEIYQAYDAEPYWSRQWAQQGGQGSGTQGSGMQGTQQQPMRQDGGSQQGQQKAQ